MEQHSRSPVDDEKADEPVSALEPIKRRVSPWRPLYFFTFLSAALLDVLLLDVALVFQRWSFAYQWLNRIGILLGLILTPWTVET